MSSRAAGGSDGGAVLQHGLHPDWLLDFVGASGVATWILSGL